MYANFLYANRYNGNILSVNEVTGNILPFNVKNDVLLEIFC